MKAEHERALLLHLRAKAWHKEGLIDGAAEQAIRARFEQPWRVNGPLAYVVYLGLTAGGIAAFYSLFELISDDFAGYLTAVLSILLAELLIRRRWWATGVEVALWAGGLLAFVSTLPSSGTPESMLVIAAVFAITGLRLRNPIAGTIAAGIVAGYFEERFDLGTLAAVVMAALAMLGLLRTWRRPSTEWLLILLTLALPFTGISHADEVWRPLTIQLYLVFTAVALLLALTRRHHAWFLAALAGGTIAGIEISSYIEAPDEAKLAASGAFLLALAFAVSRLLRGRTTGFVLTPANLTSVDEELHTAATLTLKPDTPVTAPQDPGGGFGGAGASGEY